MCGIDILNFSSVSEEKIWDSVQNKFVTAQFEKRGSVQIL